MGRNKLDLQEDENLAEEVRKYPCLYNKSSKDYKSKTAVRATKLVTMKMIIVKVKKQP